MPHIDVKYSPSFFRNNTGALKSAADLLIGLVAKHFQEQPEYVSLEIIPQQEFTRNRKDVDLELNSSPDDAGLRSKVAEDLSRELAEALGCHLAENGYPGAEISAWIRVFEAGVYQYHVAP